QLGISRRLVAYYSSKRQVPRYIALACRYLDRELASKSADVEHSAADNTLTSGATSPSPFGLLELTVFERDILRALQTLLLSVPGAERSVSRTPDEEELL